MKREIRRTLLELVADGGAPVVVLDVDEHRLYADDAGPLAAEHALASLARVVSTAAARAKGHLHLVATDRFMVTLPASTYEEAVGFAERTVDEVRALAIPFARVPGGRLSVTAAVASVETGVDVERFDARVDDLLRDGKSTGGDAVIRDR